MPDELSIGHEYRLRVINNCTSTKNLYSLIDKLLAELGYETNNLPKLHQLALASSIAPTDYARQHSMLSIHRFADHDGSKRWHGSSTTFTYSRQRGMIPQRSGGYCCIKCIENDLKKHPFSWYRRNHHITGVDWCSTHSVPLCRVDSNAPFEQLPHVWLAEDQLLQPKPCVPTLPEDGFLHRYVKLSVQQLGRQSPFDIQKIRSLLAKQAKQSNLRVIEEGVRPLISDRLVELAPKEWLEASIPEFSTKKSKKFFYHIDSLAISRPRAGTGDGYLMAIAALYNSVEDALADLSSLDKAENVITSTARKVNRSPKFWDGDIWDEYLMAKGIHSEMANRLGLERSYLGDRMFDLGLPSLHKVKNSAVWRAFLQFSRGKSLEDSCSAEQVDPAELELLLRHCSTRVYRAIQKIQQNS